jgi:hypothetical protein
MATFYRGATRVLRKVGLQEERPSKTVNECTGPFLHGADASESNSPDILLAPGILEMESWTM